MEQQLLGKFFNYWVTCFGISKFRHVRNHTPWLFDDFLKLKNLGFNNPNAYDNCGSVELADNLNLEEYRNM